MMNSEDKDPYELRDLMDESPLLVSRLEVVGIDSLLKLVDALTSKVNSYEITISTDSYQSDQDGEYRAFLVDIRRTDI